VIFVDHTAQAAVLVAPLRKGNLLTVP
jgi:hypothetical protein